MELHNFVLTLPRPTEHSEENQHHEDARHFYDSDQRIIGMRGSLTSVGEVVAGLSRCLGPLLNSWAQLHNRFDIRQSEPSTWGAPEPASNPGKQPAPHATLSVPGSFLQW
jgi:hypothetical protein